MDDVAQLRLANHFGANRRVAHRAADQFEDDAEAPWIDRPPELTTEVQQVQWSR